MRSLRMLGTGLLSLLAACGSDGTDPEPEPAQLTIAMASTSGDGQSGLVTYPLRDSIRVRVLADGQPAEGITVNWTVQGRAALVLPVSSVSNADGYAATQWVLGEQAVSQTAQAAAGGAIGGPITFTADAAPAAATGFIIVSGDSQVVAAGSPFPLPLTAKVMDFYGNGIPDQSVYWVMRTVGDTVRFETTTHTDGAGLARISAGEEGPGVYQVTAHAVNVVGDKSKVFYLKVD